MSDGEYVPVTYENCSHAEGPYFHGTSSALDAGDELVPGFGSNFHQDHTSHHVYFSANLESAVWGAELATRLAGKEDLGHVYLVQPTGPFEDDPNLTNTRFPGNPTRSYRTRSAVRVVAEVTYWEGHPPEVVQAMLDHLARLREQGLDVIKD